ncbi:hypothetical protein J4727_07115 [Providencia rettgeri]|uniref:Uncharacterized protein n=1 Tax=Providencia rettgeri TaxID=587 RepID=A0A939NBM8_PRORE|nr:hypothetical protein [Providencia rettgeri]
MATPIDIESLLDKNGKVDLSSKENIEKKHMRNKNYFWKKLKDLMNGNF